ncbi:diguanylate cyclase [Roseibium sp.]|uniref:diguanylate cyclase n=1 Tax=Roseibium sp. TaxID=1936156 RepID=UPI003A970936
MAKLVAEALVTKEHQHAFARMSEVRAHIEGRVAETVALGESVRSYAGLNPDLQQAEFSKISAALMEANSSIQLVGLAPNNILEFVHPLAPNLKAIGLNYRTNAAQWPSVAKAINTRSVVVSGPVNLVQGGRALVIRVPIFLIDDPTQPVAERPYWGVGTLVVREDRLFDGVGLEKVMEDLDVAVVKVGELASEDVLIYGDGHVLDQASLRLPIELPGGTNWHLLAHPANGWQVGGKELWLTRFVGLTLSLLFAAMVFLILYEMQKIWSMALHDPLTGLANRRLLEDRMRQLALLENRTGQGFEIFYVDLDGFKPVNDNYGHLVGDQVLMEVGVRLGRQIRSSDTLARVGGDEFIILAAGTMGQEERQQFEQRLDRAISTPIDLTSVDVEMTASIGAASYPQDTRSTEELLKLADARMYAQKNGRSDRYASEPQPQSQPRPQPLRRSAGA